MINSFFTSLLLVCLLSFQQGKSQSLHILSYNIHHGCDIHEKLQLKGIADIITKSKADIVGLEEVDSVCNRSGNTDQAKILSELTGLHYAYVRHFAFDSGSYGLALLSRFPITKVINKRLPVLTQINGNTRALLWAKVELSSGKEILVLVAHLDYRSDSSRRRQSKIITGLVKKEHTPVILLGDLNATPDSKTISNLNRYFKDTNSPDDFTYPADGPEKKIDYILVDKRHFIKTLNGGVYKVNYSDHRPIFSEIRLSL